MGSARASRFPLLSALFHLGPALAYLGVIFYFGVMPAPPAAPSVVGWDKLQHAVAFGGLVLVTLPALAWAAPESQLRPRLLVATAISTLFGAVLELVQAFSPPRTADVLDWIADTVGALAVAGAVYAVAALAGRRQA